MPIVTLNKAVVEKLVGKELPLEQLKDRISMLGTDLESVEGIRPYTACAIVKGLQFDEETLKQIIQIQEKLHVTYGRKRKKAAIGIYPMEKITFPITYKADLPQQIKFKPLEAHAEMTALEILEHHKAGKEYAHLLQGLAKYPIFV